MKNNLQFNYLVEEERKNKRMDTYDNSRYAKEYVSMIELIKAHLDY